MLNRMHSHHLSLSSILWIMQPPVTIQGLWFLKVCMCISWKSACIYGCGSVNAYITAVCLLYGAALPFHLFTPYLWAPQRPSLAAPALSLITQCQAFNKSLTGVSPWTTLFIKGLHCQCVLENDWSHHAQVCPSCWLTERHPHSQR